MPNTSPTNNARVIGILALLVVVIPLSVLAWNGWKHPDEGIVAGGVDENQQPPAPQTSGRKATSTSSGEPPLGAADTRVFAGSLADVVEHVIAGAVVHVSIPGELQPREQESDTSGRFTFSIPVVPRIRFAVRAEGFVPVAIPDLFPGPSMHCVMERAVVFQGRVFTAESGAPIASARILIESRGLDYPCRSSTDGGFAVEVPPGRLRLSIQAMGHRRLVQGALHAGPGRGVQRFQLSRSVWITGTVTDERGAVIAGARIGSVENFRTAVAPLGSSDREGRFRIEDDGSFELLDVRSPGYRPWRRAPTGSESGAMRVVLVRGAEFRGVVVGPNGRPVSAAHVFLSGAGFAESTRTNATGNFRLPALPRPGRARVVAAHPEYSSATSEFEGDTRGLKLQLSAAAIVRGQVRSAGVPVQGCRITLVAAGPLPESAVGRELETATDHEGQFEFARIPAGVLRLQASLPGGGPVQSRILVATAGQTMEVDLDVIAACRLSGHVTAAGVRGIAGARVHWQVAGETRATTFSERDGAFALDVMAGRGELIAEHPGYVRVGRAIAARQTMIDTELRDLQIPMRAARWIEGTVQCPSEQIGSFVVHYRSRQGHAGDAVRFFGGDGSFRIGPVVDGSFEIRATAVGWVASPWKRVEVQRVDARTDLRLTRGILIGGILVDVKGAPVRLPITLLRTDKTIAATTAGDRRGQFSFEPVAPGRYGLRVGSVLAPVTELPPREFHRTGEQLRIVVETLGSVTVHVEKPDGSRCDGAQVELHSLSSGERRRAFTDAKGAVQFASVPPGDYRLSFSSGKGRCAPVSVGVVAGAAMKKTVRLR